MSHTILPTASIIQLLNEVQGTQSLPTLSKIRPPYDPAEAIPKPPRPPNNFVLFRSWVGKEFGKCKVPLASHVWNKLQEKRSHIVTHFSVLSGEAQTLHHNAFPGYQYRPKRRKSDATERSAETKKVRGEKGVKNMAPAQHFTDSSPARTSTVAISSPCESVITTTSSLIWTPILRPSYFSAANLSHCKVDGKNDVDLLPPNNETSYVQCSSQSSGLAAFNESNFNIHRQKPSPFQQVPDLPIHLTQLHAHSPFERMASLLIDMGTSISYGPFTASSNCPISDIQVHDTRYMQPMNHNQYLIAAPIQSPAVNESTESSESTSLDYSLYLPNLNVDSPVTDNSLESPAPLANVQVSEVEDTHEAEFDQLSLLFV